MIGVLGGTFDPVHLGHVGPALDLLRGLPLREIRFVLVRIPAHRASPLASPQDRWRMLCLAVEDQAGLVADDRELRREGASYTVDTLRELREELGGATPLCLIMGSDAFEAFTCWRRWEDILDIANIVIASRPGAALSAQCGAARLLEQRRLATGADLSRSGSGGILPWPVRPIDISATKVRALLAAGEDASAMLPAAVWRYIREHKLYSVSHGATSVSKVNNGNR